MTSTNKRVAVAKMVGSKRTANPGRKAIAGLEAQDAILSMGEGQEAEEGTKPQPKPEPAKATPPAPKRNSPSSPKKTTAPKSPKGGAEGKAKAPKLPKAEAGEKKRMIAEYLAANRVNLLHPCACGGADGKGCEAMVPRTFAPGHDAKLYSRLRKLAAAVQ